MVLAIWLLPFLRLLTIEAADALTSVLAHFIFVDDGILLAGMAFGALARGLSEVRVGLIRFNSRTRTLDQKRA